MTRFLILHLTALLLAFVALTGRAHARDEVVPSAAKMKLCQWMADVYNRCDDNVRFDRRANTVLFPRLNRTLLCDDGLALPFLERLNNSDLSSMLSQSYKAGRVSLPETRKDYSPGGIRSDDIFKQVYGASPEEVRKNMVKIAFLGHQVRFNPINGAAMQLARVSDELLKLYDEGKDEKLVAFLKPFITRVCTPGDKCLVENNTFNWRSVAGSNRPSAHSFGTAIDLQPQTGHEYWLWDVRDQISAGKAKFRPGTDPQKFTERDVLNFTPVANPTYPEKVVEVFERHGFIWGGKWYRYDIMHFEYRPEFFPKLQTPCP